MRLPRHPSESSRPAYDVGRARYDSLQVKAETKSARHGLYALFGYTYSRTFDSGFPDGLGTLPGATILALARSAKGGLGFIATQPE